MAERIADPVRRLTRATGRIARGDFDARIAVRSSDELRRLVDAFNGMAAELKAQRGQLERTHRLEAWAEMARQVAHEIKNPLTPIQLSAEHLRRVHADRGEPMGPVLEGCVDVDPRTGPAAAPDRLGVLQLRLVTDRAPRACRSGPSWCATSSTRIASGLGDRIAIDNEISPPPAGGHGRSHARRAGARQHRRERAARDARSRAAAPDARRVDDGFVTIRVADTGVGMDEEALERVFEPYFSTKTTGTGLGLPIARRNIELSGGTIEVTSEKGRGTAVSVILPVAS